MIALERGVHTDDEWVKVEDGSKGTFPVTPANRGPRDLGHC